MLIESTTDITTVSSRQDSLTKYDHFVQRVGFRYYGPLSRLKGFGRLSDLVAKFNVRFEIVNTRLPSDEREMKRG
jgi:hypothetical protein